MIKYEQDVANLIEQLIKYSNIHLGTSEDDNNYFRNALMNVLKIDTPAEKQANEVIINQMKNPISILEQLSACAISKGYITEQQIDSFETNIMGIITPLPSKVIETFDDTRKNFGSDKACSYLFNLGKLTNYMKTAEIAKNISWVGKASKSDLHLTINVCKPEKDNAEIAKMKTGLSYPKCQLCIENEGYLGRDGYPSKNTLRTIPLTLNSEKWHMQFSPYAYYNEHCIILSNEHTPMQITKNTFKRLIDFVEIFPHYFIGSNASIPIVGGSILAHEHYQGGAHKMPLFSASSKTYFENSDYKGVTASIIDWYNSVIRLESSNKDELCEAGWNITESWSDYSDNELNITAKTAKQHNAVTPIARKEHGKFVMDIVLRNNRTNANYPDGIFHTHPEYFNIKKEGLGIIEVLGLFVLPGRLQTELAGIVDYITNKKRFSAKIENDETNPLHKHFKLVRQIIKKYSNELSEEDADIVIKEQLTEICEKMLCCSAVFKNNKDGISGFEKFLNTSGYFKKKL